MTTATQLELVFPSPVVSTASGTDYALALLQDGTVWSVGGNGNGQLGDGTTTDRSTWAKIPSLSGVTQIAASGFWAMALLGSGSVMAWGSNSSGQLGDGSITDRSTPVAVNGISSPKQIGCGFRSGYALLSDGTVRAWGANNYGQLGNGGTTASTTPVQVLTFGDAKQIACGNHHVYALLGGGTVAAWGFNEDGELGDGTTTNRPTPITVANVAGVTQVTSTNYSGHALLNNGKVVSWGSNSSGQMGNGTGNTNVLDRSTNAVVVSGITTATQVAATNSSVFALLGDGSIKAWGSNTGGQLGDGTTTNRTVPVDLTGASDVTSLPNTSLGNARFLVVGPRTITLASLPSPLPTGITTGIFATMTDSKTGAALSGQSVTFDTDLGWVSPVTVVTDSSGRATTTLVAGDPYLFPQTTITVRAGSGGVVTTTSAPLVGANAFAVGSNDTGNVGTAGGAGTDSTSPTLTSPTQLSKVFPSPILTVGSGNGFSIALLEDGTVWGVGNNESGQLGDGTTTSRTRWALVSGLTNVTGIAVAERLVLAVTSSGAVYRWGQDLNGQNNSINSTPQLVAGITTAIQVALVCNASPTGSTLIALLSDGRVLTWGGGALGDGTRAYRTTPSPVTGISTAIAIAGGTATAFALLSDGTIRSWGSSTGSNLGNGSTTFAFSPVTVTGISTATAIAAGGYSTFAMLTDGTIRAWGDNGQGQLGDGTTTTRGTPAAVAGISSATALGTSFATAYAVLENGRSVGWGANDQGQLGDNTGVAQTTPVAFPQSGGNLPPIRSFGVNSTSKRGFAIIKPSI
ncbi:RCC1 domain-containing protein [Microbacterium hydrothermale]|uniref:RCC1 domain-containing protein n=1 Tax=Microbacterium hydrothermale TaxID=857427 RepID=UPI001F0D530C|nr:hypothetical protein [Microbacterium hydrothermale]